MQAEEEEEERGGRLAMCILSRAELHAHLREERGNLVILSRHPLFLELMCLRGLREQAKREREKREGEGGREEEKKGGRKGECGEGRRKEGKECGLEGGKREEWNSLDCRLIIAECHRMIGHIVVISMDTCQPRLQ